MKKIWENHILEFHYDERADKKKIQIKILKSRL